MDASAKLKSNKYTEKLLGTLNDGVKPALGCTEPVAVGLAVAKAFEVVKGYIEEVDVKVSPNIYKNGIGVGIPGTSEIGLVFASALAVSCGDSDLGLEVFKYVNDEAVDEAEKIVANNIINVDVEDKKGNFYIRAKVKTDIGQGVCVIKDSHTNIVYISSSEKILLDKNEVEETDSNSNGYLKDVRLQDIKEFIESVSYSDIEFLLEGVKLNMDIAKVGLEEESGPAIGAAMNKLTDEGVMPKDIINEARILTSAACDARMAGVNMPVMSSAGSGNHGITAIIPPVVMCKNLNCDDEKLARTLAFSHLVTAYIKVFTGPLSPVCGCAVAAGIGASASIAWALGGGNEEIEGAIKNMVGTLTGMVCDGAKGGCAFKLSTASSEAIIQAQLAMKGAVINDLDGIVNPKVEETIKNLGSFSDKGMRNADEEIINIILNN